MQVVMVTRMTVMMEHRSSAREVGTIIIPIPE